ncbi:MAG: hypothetical protein J5J06_09095 [Phycisphaerae bacterium]|nr:hypothetical protein [Phycisphaerae bacterium]
MICRFEHAIGDYEWWYTRVPDEAFRFDLRQEGPADGALRPADPPIGPGGGNRPPAWLDNLLISVLNRNVGPKSSCMTDNGSFWSGDVATDLALIERDTVLPGLIPGPTRSLAVLPFDIAYSVPGVLALMSTRKHVFSAHNVGFYEALAQTLGLAMDDRRAQHALRERVKELTCLYAVAKVLESTDGAIVERLPEIARLLPPAWQFPDILVARIRVDDAAFATGDDARSVHRQEATVLVDGVARGTVEVGYLEDRPEFVEGAFLREEAHLIGAVARELALFVQRRDARLERAHMATIMRQTDRLATIGRLAAGVAHEINEPLGGILGFAQLARKTANLPAQVVQDLERIIQAALYARDIVRKLMLFARQSPPSRDWVQLSSLVDESLSLLAPRVQEFGVEVRRELDPVCPKVYADPVQLSQVIVNLCVNAIQAMPGGGILTVRTRKEDGEVTIVVEDTGAGIASDIADRIFEPFFTTKSPEQGTGLGLSVVHGIVISHGGKIHFQSQPGAGSRFEVKLPASSPLPAMEDQRSNG